MRLSYNARSFFSSSTSTHFWAPVDGQAMLSFMVAHDASRTCVVRPVSVSVRGLDGVVPRRRRHECVDERARVRLAQGSVAASGAAGERAARWPQNSVQEPPDARARRVVARSAIGAA